MIGAVLPHSQLGDPSTHDRDSRLLLLLLGTNDNSRLSRATQFGWAEPGLDWRIWKDGDQGIVSKGELALLLPRVFLVVTLRGEGERERTADRRRRPSRQSCSFSPSRSSPRRFAINHTLSHYLRQPRHGLEEAPFATLGSTRSGRTTTRLFRSREESGTHLGWTDGLGMMEHLGFPRKVSRPFPLDCCREGEERGRTARR